ncbi:putative cysteine-rich receptor-like protein kinase 16 isoform X3 [Arabidopsis lyrata subsp. lyrata]|uniref:putative cysteine-rich receptor-like protein kinase 16 isoform X3 n=1 Tax=Arabidopsis lyrata subsp. lyrata TaxID=81972 RepID=UPI000A29C43A|nr:putative cysteine-rich receptor-like protein kinase 16 isoform X3 [Arabidopsis lyrata subsp. lyrata]|eukprot:XP_020873348.1 putative cysteine-rich receptor-like protein kinase 16 isoform X3 [Arabidopsis lyrata subsp. lyrata]
MKLKNLLPVLCFFLLSFPVLSAQRCGKTGFSILDDTFDTNRRLLLSSLASNASDQGGFYSASVGQGSERVYAEGLCIPGAEPKDCSNCLNHSSNSVIERCRNQTEGLIWSDDVILCMIRFSNRLFSGSLEIEPSYDLIVNGDIQVNLTEFDRSWEDLTSHMIVEATSSSSQRKYYAAEAVSLTSFQNIYLLMQCTPFISLRDCNTCLTQSVTDYKSCCYGKKGGNVNRPSCYFRWEIYPFSQAFNNTLSHPAPLPPSRTPSGGHRTNTNKRGIIVGITVVLALVISVLLALGYALCRRRKASQEFATERSSMTNCGTAPPDDGSLQFEFKAIQAATSNFQKSNKLGHGGFGEVYKGTFPNGIEVAVKRLSKTSGQGEHEFKNEVLLVAKLQHRNLVRLLGFSVEGEEMILVYEFVHNKSLDYFLFDPVKRGQLDWRKRYNIIEGITRGILYLHQDSRLTIIHRDLKASNILLDADMNPKIADFGMARNFRVDQTEDNTGRVVGTFGYMPPEYVANGQFSMKSDVYSFGVLILEIIVCKKSSSFHQIDSSVGNLVTYVWRLWNNGLSLELIDPAIGENYDKDEVIRCIHIGLLCVQENPADRPTMSNVFQMLTNNSITLPVPQTPGFVFTVRSEPNPLAERYQPRSSTAISFACSIDDASITSVNPR